MRTATRIRLWCISLALCAAGLVAAPIALSQVGGQNAGSLSNPYGGNLNASTTNCIGVANACAWQTLPPNATTTAVVVSGTFSGTVTFEQSSDCFNFVAASTPTTTAPGTFTFTTAGVCSFRARMSAYVSGTASVNITTAFSGTGTTINTSSGSGITPVASLPTTCTAGQAFLLPSGIIVACPATNIFALGTVPGAVDPTAFGAKYDAHFNGAPSFTNTGNIVTCTTCNFTGTDLYGRPIAKVGQIVFGSNTTTDVSQATSIFITPECGIQSIDSATQIHMGTIGSLGTACNATATTTASGFIFWGDLDSNTSAGGAQTAGNDPIFGAWTQAAANCVPYHHPAGVTLVERGEWNTYPTGAGTCGTQDALTVTRQGFTITGEGSNASIVIITPNFSATNECKGPNAGSIGCFCSVPNPTLHDWQLWGAGNSAGGLSGKAGIYISGLSPGTNFELSRMQINGWGAATTGFYGVNVGNGVSLAISGGTFSQTNIEAFGALTCYINPLTGTITIYADALWCSVGQTALTVNGGVFGSVNGLYGDTTVAFGGTTGVAFLCQNGSFCSSTNDTMTFPGNNGVSFLCTGASTRCSLSGDTISNNGTAAVGLLVGQTSGVANVMQVNGTYVNAPFPIFMGNGTTCNAGGCKFFSLGGNSFVATTTGYTNATNATVMFAPTDTFSGFSTTIQPTCTFTSGGGTTPSCSTSTGSTNEKGVIIATTGTGAPASAGTVTLTFVGTFIGGTSSAPACTYTLDNSGTAWGNQATAFVSTQSTTAPVLAWTNTASAVLTALATSSAYRIDYTCEPR